MFLRERPWLLGLGVLCAVLLAWVLWRSQQAIVTIRFVPRQQGTVIDSIDVTVGAEKQHATHLKSGAVEHFVFVPQPDSPLVLGFWVGTENRGWEGPVLRAGHRLEVTLDAEEQVLWSECSWPCLGKRRTFSGAIDR